MKAMKKVTLLSAIGILLLGGVGGALVWSRIETQPVFYLGLVLGFAVLNLIGAYVVLKYSRKNKMQLFPSVDLADTFRAARAYGSQPPVFEGQGFNSRVFAVETMIRVTGLGQSVVVENWDGPEVLVRGGRKQVRLAARQIVRLKNPGSIEIENLEDSLTAASACVLIHDVGSNG
jgi:hypothetical protein